MLNSFVTPTNSPSQVTECPGAPIKPRGKASMDTLDSVRTVLFI